MKTDARRTTSRRLFSRLLGLGDRRSGLARLPVGAVSSAVLAALSLSSVFFVLEGCGDNGTALSDVERPAEPACTQTEVPRTYEVFFVIDVSGSMEPFLSGIRDQIVAFIDSLPAYDHEGRRTSVDYYIVGFVNDVKWFPEESPRLTSQIAVQDALDRAIKAGSNDQNLTQQTYNAEEAENLLDAIASVIQHGATAEVRMMFIATDAPFVEAPAELSGHVQVQTTYKTAFEGLKNLGFQVHAFAGAHIDGLTRPFGGLAPLTSLPGSSVNDLDTLLSGNRGDNENKIASALSEIGREASCSSVP